MSVVVQPISSTTVFFVDCTKATPPMVLAAGPEKMASHGFLFRYISWHGSAICFENMNQRLQYLPSLCIASRISVLKIFPDSDWS